MLQKIIPPEISTPDPTPFVMRPLKEIPHGAYFQLLVRAVKNLHFLLKKDMR
jgi:hypothetical protein